MTIYLCNLDYCVAYNCTCRQIIHRPAYHCRSSKAARSIINVPKNCPCSNRQYWTNESSYHQAVAVVE